VTAEYLQELSCFETPQVDIVRLNGARSNDVASACFNRQAAELCRLWSRHRPEVAILHEVEGPHSAIEARRHDCISFLRRELERCDLGGVIRESDETEAVLRRPQLDFAIITTSGNIAAIRRVRDCVQVKEVPLLLEHVCLALPFPYEQLALVLASKSDPVTS